jgi:hypothetical protein
LHPTRGEEENVLGDVQDLIEELKNLKKEAEDKWNLDKTRLIKDPLIFTKKKRKINYYVMQILTGHGIFNHYRHRIGKESPVVGIVETNRMIQFCSTAPDG